MSGLEEYVRTSTKRRHTSPTKSKFVQKAAFRAGQMSPDVSPTTTVDDVVELMDTPQGRYALRRLLAMRKSPKQTEQVAEFAQRLGSETQRNFGIVSQQIKLEFQRLLASIAPDLLQDYDVLTVAMRQIAPEAVEFILHETSRASQLLLAALTYAFGNSMDIQVYGRFTDWPAKIAYSKIQNYKREDTDLEAIPSIRELLSEFDRQPMKTSDERSVAGFLYAICNSFGDRAAKASVRVADNARARSYKEDAEWIYHQHQSGFPDTVKTRKLPAHQAPQPLRGDELESPENVCEPQLCVVTDADLSPPKRSKPRKKMVESPNSKFIKLRQNDRGQTVALQHFKSRSFNDFKASVASANRPSNPKAQISMDELFEADASGDIHKFCPDSLAKWADLARLTGTAYLRPVFPGEST